MKFVFPQNYDFKNKLFGVIDYSTVFINLIWCVLVFFLITLFVYSLSVKICVFFVLCFPLLLFSFVGFYGENIVYVFSYLFRFFTRPKLFVYRK